MQSIDHPIRRCAADAVPTGAACLDKYEATVWRVPGPAAANAILVRRIQLGTATRADLTARGATQLGVGGRRLRAVCGRRRGLRRRRSTP
jgi:hypothetical protein